MSDNPTSDRATLLYKNVRENAHCQSTVETRENYFQSCEKHGGDIASVVADVRKEFLPKKE